MSRNAFFVSTFQSNGPMISVECKLVGTGDIQGPGCFMGSDGCDKSARGGPIEGVEFKLIAQLPH